jgi:hypothetical protein
VGWLASDGGEQRSGEREHAMSPVVGGRCGRVGDRRCRSLQLAGHRVRQRLLDVHEVRLDRGRVGGLLSRHLHPALPLGDSISGEGDPGERGRIWEGRGVRARTGRERGDRLARAPKIAGERECRDAGREQLGSRVWGPGDA